MDKNTTGNRYDTSRICTEYLKQVSAKHVLCIKCFWCWQLVRLPTNCSPYACVLTRMKENDLQTYSIWCQACFHPNTCSFTTDSPLGHTCLALGSVRVMPDPLSHSGVHLGYLWPKGIGKSKCIKKTFSTEKMKNNWNICERENQARWEITISQMLAAKLVYSTCLFGS